MSTPRPLFKTQVVSHGFIKETDCLRLVTKTASLFLSQNFTAGDVVIAAKSDPELNELLNQLNFGLNMQSERQDISYARRISTILRCAVNIPIDGVTLIFAHRSNGGSRPYTFRFVPAAAPKQRPTIPLAQARPAAPPATASTTVVDAFKAMRSQDTKLQTEQLALLRRQTDALEAQSTLLSKLNENMNNLYTLWASPVGATTE
jgi:hypothetical protein